MWIDLLLQHAQLRRAQVQLLHAYILHEMPDLLHHLVKAAVQNRELIQLLVLRPDRKIPASRCLRSLTQPLDGLRDAPHNPPADHPCPEQYQDENHCDRRDGTLHIRADSHPQLLHVRCLIVDIIMDLLLYQLRQDADIQIQTLHVRLIKPGHERILLDLLHTILQRVKTL